VIRLRLFAFYAYMALGSLIKPSWGMEMIEHAIYGKGKADRDKFLKRFRGAR
jgi:hypothetical protein